MAFLDLTDVLLDPELSDTFSVVQRTEVVSQKGVSTTVTNTVPNVVGVIVPATPNDLQRLPETDFGHRALKVRTPFRLNGPTKTRKPDVVLWGNDQFIVRSVDPYTRFGAGWTEALVVNMDSLEAVT